MINNNNVSNIFNDCLFKEQDDPTECIILVDSSNNEADILLHLGRLNSHTEEINSMIYKLHKQFLDEDNSDISFGEFYKNKLPSVRKLLYLFSAISKLN